MKRNTYAVIRKSLFKLEYLSMFINLSGLGTEVTMFLPLYSISILEKEDLKIFFLMFGQIFLVLNSHSVNATST